MSLPIPWQFVLIVLVALVAVLMAVRARKAGHLSPPVAWAVIVLGVAATILLFIWPILPFVDRRIDDGVPLDDAPAVAPVNPAAPAVAANTEGGTPAATPAMADYLLSASAVDLFEVQSGELAMRHGHASAVQDLGKRFAIEHRQSAASLARIAQASGLPPPPPALAPGHTVLLRRMEAARKGDFDQVWLKAQAEAHKAALQLHNEAARTLPAGQMASFAKAQAQKVTSHLEHVQSVARTDGTG